MNINNINLPLYLLSHSFKKRKTHYNIFDGIPRPLPILSPPRNPRPRYIHNKQHVLRLLNGALMFLPRHIGNFLHVRRILQTQESQTSDRSIRKQGPEER